MSWQLLQFSTSVDSKDFQRIVCNREASAIRFAEASPKAGFIARLFRCGDHFRER